MYKNIIYVIKKSEIKIILYQPIINLFNFTGMSKPKKRLNKKSENKTKANRIIYERALINTISKMKFVWLDHSINSNSNIKDCKNLKIS